MLVDYREFKWRDAKDSPTPEEARGRFVVQLFWPQSKEISFCRAKYYRLKGEDFWGKSYRMTWAEMGAEVRAWAPVEQVFLATEAA